MRILLCILLTFPGVLRAQNYFSDHFGGSAGIVIQLGTHVNSVGFNLKAYYTDYFFQLNANSSLFLHASSYAGRKLFWENRNALGAVLMGGKKQMTSDFLLDGLNHQTPYNYGVGYNYLWYFDKVGTTQRSGGFALHLKSFSIYHENDVFGGQGRDRFRSGNIQVSYRKEQWRYAVGVSIWTGETKGADWQKVEWAECPNGFRILEKLPYGKTSHGILYGSVTHSYPSGQLATLRVGIDSEQVRHVIQNRLIHDLIFLPKKVHRETPHYPRLDETGCPVFEKDGIRKSKLFLQVGSNGNWSD